VNICQVARHTFILLRDVNHVSDKTRSLYRVLTRSLVVQALVPVFIVIIPFGIGTVVSTTATIYFPAESSEWLNVFDVLIIAISFHASTHCFALILTTPSFRKTL
ncbi:hypothetical protein PMAYCL1PPCAC_26309, partial [Pristionchus mayeri]